MAYTSTNAQTANAFQVHASHEACAENRGLQLMHHNYLFPKRLI